MIKAWGISVDTVALITSATFGPATTGRAIEMVSPSLAVLPAEREAAH